MESIKDIHMSIESIRIEKITNEQAILYANKDVHLSEICSSYAK